MAYPLSPGERISVQYRLWLGGWNSRPPAHRAALLKCVTQGLNRRSISKNKIVLKRMGTWLTN